MLCPHCKATLYVCEHQSIEFDYCSQCKGVWLEHGKLEQIIASTKSLSNVIYSPLNKQSITKKSDNQGQVIEQSRQENRIKPFFYGMFEDFE
ncbi:hypothetical protein CJF42_17935 [Pseudoalteromonas sp. NBT06-2]|uniref:TFIIB-type zinc ribbon-containing protein n=1 Tax=Pseudoalteromonas sp. NBT06-2 TaxID=2025950 RepID=UPI000BA5C5DF|nr:zf-TFIIB domain-containing protein [Pseudoalteromonas sp. NBT06-2]PAJ73045.1 hypothetical protein CJF42_17935 [Pseudoalteromonas sp. NBT06-2]